MPRSRLDRRFVGAERDRTHLREGGVPSLRVVAFSKKGVKIGCVSCELVSYCTEITIPSCFSTHGTYLVRWGTSGTIQRRFDFHHFAPYLNVRILRVQKLNVVIVNVKMTVTCLKKENFLSLAALASLLLNC